MEFLERLLKIPEIFKKLILDDEEGNNAKSLIFLNDPNLF